MGNRLAGETSPYLLQHKDNPVDWYPWADEALRRAREEDRPILLSIGYSACHWCHVMERESFEDPAIAARMNEGYVCIKVDREERPDLDSIYMSAVQQMTGSGGWPMTVFLTPDLKPFFGGTYFPPEPRHGMPAFLQVLTGVLDAYRQRRAEVERSADDLTAAISVGLGGGPGRHLDRAVLADAVTGLLSAHDPREGGFGGAPKFPQAMALDFLLRHHSATPDPRVLEVVETALTKMAHGGIYDQLGGGFHRYSTDDHWFAPHFEKMLYDQALLAPVYLHAYQLTGNPEYHNVATRTIDYVLRDLTSVDGGFYSAEDADSMGEEGLFYTWTWDELQELCGENLELIATTYGARAEGNWEGRNILHVSGDGNDIPRRLGMGPEEYQARLADANARLFAARDKRTRPARDEKVLTAWNGLMLAAVAEAAAVLERDDYLAAARRNAALLLDNVFADNRVLRTYRDGTARLNGYLEDYAALALGLLALYQADFDPRWYEAAQAISELMLTRFRDPDGGIFYSTSDDHEALLYRPKDFDDNAVPAGNSMAAEVLLQLALLSGEERYRLIAEEVLEALSPAMGGHPLFFGRLLGVLSAHLGNPVEVALLWQPGAPPPVPMLRALRAPYLPNKVVAGGPEGSTVPPLLEGRDAQDAPAALYICRNFTCERPITAASAVSAALGVPEPVPEGFQAL
ncbi:MAG: thioredoxin domain-containing protein [Candidatus Dormibacteria bacterium]